MTPMCEVSFLKSNVYGTTPRPNCGHLFDKRFEITTVLLYSTSSTSNASKAPDVILSKNALCMNRILS